MYANVSGGQPDEFVNALHRPDLARRPLGRPPLRLRTMHRRIREQAR